MLTVEDEKLLAEVEHLLGCGRSLVPEYQRRLVDIIKRQRAELELRPQVLVEDGNFKALAALKRKRGKR